MNNGRQLANLRLIDGETLPATCIRFNPTDANFLLSAGKSLYLS